MSAHSDASRFTDPNTAIDHVRRVARETAAESGYDAAATALLALYREYRVMPLRRKETPPDQLATWEAVRLETRSLIPMATAPQTHGADFDQRVKTPADQPLPHDQPDWAYDPLVGLQAGALRAPATTASPRPPLPSPSPAVDRAPAR